jgi:hypothetical protein
MTTQEKPVRKPIVHTPVENSSQIKSYGYHPETQTLAMVFKHGAGAEYQYPNVSAEMYAGLEAAESKGNYFGRVIKPLPFEKYAPGAEAQAAASEPATDEPTPATAEELEAAGQERLVG